MLFKIDLQRSLELAFYFDIPDVKQNQYINASIWSLIKDDRHSALTVT